MMTGLYSITDSLVGQNAEWEGVENSDGIEVEVFVLPQQGAGVTQKAMVKVMDNQVGFQTAEESWSKPLANVAFDGSLGVLAQGARIFVCVGSGTCSVCVYVCARCLQCAVVPRYCIEKQKSAEGEMVH